MTLAFTEALSRLLSSRSSEPGLVRDSFDEILCGRWTPVQVGAFAAVLRSRGESADELTEAARALRSAMTPVEHGLANPVIDTCGTGGDGAGTLNVSTAAAIIVAACRVHVAKHGNRSISSRSGSADVVQALGIPLEIGATRQAEILREARIAFLFAPSHHPALKHAAQARRELGVRTIFNALGPVCNPGRATHQLIGVYDDALRHVLAHVLAKLGCTRAWVVRSADGLDELSPAAETFVSEVVGDRVVERVVSPEEFGFARSDLSVVAGGDAETNARAIMDVIEGRPHVATNAIFLNAAAALFIAGVGDTPRAAVEVARESIKTGSAGDTLERWRELANAKESP